MKLATFDPSHAPETIVPKMNGEQSRAFVSCAKLFDRRSDGAPAIRLFYRLRERAATDPAIQRRSFIEKTDRKEPLSCGGATRPPPMPARWPFPLGLDKKWQGRMATTVFRMPGRCITQGRPPAGDHKSLWTLVERKSRIYRSQREISHGTRQGKGKGKLRALS